MGLVGKKKNASTLTSHVYEKKVRAQKKILSSLFFSIKSKLWGQKWVTELKLNL